MKVWNYIVILTAMTVILELLGIRTGLADVLSPFGIQLSNDPSLINADIVNSERWSFILGILGLSIGSAVVVGFVTRTLDTRIITAPIITSVLIIFGSTALKLLNYANTLNAPWLVGIIAIVFIPLGIGYLLSILDYFNGYT